MGTLARITAMRESFHRLRPRRAWAAVALAALIGLLAASASCAQSPDRPNGTELYRPVGPLVQPGTTLVQPGTTLTQPGITLAQPGVKLYQPGQSLVVGETASEVRVTIPADILFDFDKATIRPEAASALQQVAAVLRERRRGSVRIEGHTDSMGSSGYNLRLSERRAVAVETWLMEHEGFSDAGFRTVGYGASRPVAPNTKPDGSDDPAGRQRNRRVELVMAK